MSGLFIMFWEFFKTGLFAVGGGMATIPFLNDMARRFSWLSDNTISDMIAVSESTPGPIGVNMATYAGYSAFGVLGGITATIGLVLPSVIIIFIISKFMDKFGNSFAVDAAFYGIRPVVTALIAIAGLSILKSAFFNGLSASLPEISLNIKSIILFFVIIFAVFKFKRIHPFAFILFSAAAGVIFHI